MKIFFILLVFTLAASGWAHDKTDWRLDQKAYQSFKVAPEFEWQNALEDFLAPTLGPIDAAYLKLKLTELAGPQTKERRSADGKAAARAYLAAEYTKLGFAVGELPYNGGVNFIAEKKGTDGSKILILSSHLDSMGNQGADDDGIGTIGALAVAQALSKTSFKSTLRILAFDQEELGLVGSHAYVNLLTNPAAFIGDINMEMMAVNKRKDGAFHIIDCDRADSKPLTNAIMGAITALGLPIHRTAACTNRSDHASFWAKNIGAVVLSENFFGGDADPCYHAKCDIVDARLDFEYAANITRAVASATAVLLQ